MDLSRQIIPVDPGEVAKKMVEILQEENKRLRKELEEREKNIEKEESTTTDNVGGLHFQISCQATQ